ncbi:MAG: hypothetical protein LBK03_00510 [Bacteroidales bacterium]|jgi:hypothetical protein|nr:hypothetical protein [Bacteroidales bacterium]
MKKATALLLLLAITLTGLAQKRTDSIPNISLLPVPDFYTHELGVSAGYAPSFITGDVLTFGGALNVEYYKNFTSRHAIGVTVNTIAAVANSLFFDPNYNPNRDNFVIALAAFSGYRHTFYRKNDISLYFSVFVGVTVRFIYPPVYRRYMYDNKPLIHISASNILIPAQLNIFGCSVGTKNQFYFELGFGSKGMVTVGYKVGMPGKYNTPQFSNRKLKQ